MSTKYGYARVSTIDQNLDLQKNALQLVSCTQIYTDHGISGANSDRPGLNKLLRKIKAGDTLVVWRLDRLGRSLPYLVNTIEALGKKHVHFVSLMENIDTSTSGGKLLFHMMAALAEFERSLISERTRAGIAAARANGKSIGKPPSLSVLEQEEILVALQNQTAPKELAKLYGVHARTIQRIKAKACGQNS